MNGWPMLHGQGWLQGGELLLAFVLSALVGLEREFRHKAAGLRTYSLVGVSAALFMLVSKHGFDDVLAPGIVLDPSRVAAQVVSGIGFIGGGVIFMRRNVVRGLTTAASIWLTAALGMACGAGLPVLAVATTAGHFVVMLAFPRLVARVLPAGRRTPCRLRIAFRDRESRLEDMLVACSALRFDITAAEVEREGVDAEGEPSPRGVSVLSLEVKGRRPAAELVVRLAGVEGVLSVGTVETDGLD